MKTADAKKALLDYVRKHDHVSMVQAVRILGEHVDPKGSLAMCHSEFQNIILWAGLSEEANGILLDLFQSGLIHWKTTPILVYMADGAALNFPLAKSLRAYKTPRWLPVVLRPGPDPNRPK
jgi:hypothetical protein